MSNARQSSDEPSSWSLRASDLRGFSQLAIDAIAGTTGVVEDMHRNIAGLAPIVGRPLSGPTRGITGLTYRNVRGVTRLVGGGLNAVLGQVESVFDRAETSPGREQLLAAVNGVWGDHLEATQNPLMVPMQLRRDGQAVALTRRHLARALPKRRSRLLVFLHGLCMSDLSWERGEPSHADRLEHELGYAALYVNYNSGRRVSVNGRELADMLERLIEAWPVPVQQLVLVGHSMGGLVARSACHYASQAGLSWPGQLTHLMFLGTPHHGASLERAGNRLDNILELSPYVASLARLGKARSAGIQDLRHGNLRDEDWQGRVSTHRHDSRMPVPLPARVSCYAIAASRQTGESVAAPRSDGLVSVPSALGEHRDPRYSLAIPASNRWLAYGSHHMDLLSDARVGSKLVEWLRE
jgi:pimeloyl-ACP methyl ester carboxylesterase